MVVAGHFLPCEGSTLSCCFTYCHRPAQAQQRRTGNWPVPVYQEAQVVGRNEGNTPPARQRACPKARWLLDYRRAADTPTCPGRHVDDEMRGYGSWLQDRRFCAHPLRVRMILDDKEGFQYG